MKTVLIRFCVGLLTFCSLTPLSLAAEGDASGPGGATKVIVSEQVPWASCVPYGKGTGPGGKQFECTIQPGFKTVIGMLQNIIKYTVYIVGLIGVLMAVGTGIQYMLPMTDPKSKSELKERLFHLITGLIVLFMMGFILNTIASWVFV